ncbi:uncharacterized protein Tco025E_02386 [Trypanosoma conorhini]|uniref:Uncharacterized protein n=1 Tax=Trypanosoma conorhini TaxID=83891 RepID=A0A422Q426_9TRYP|nr:uncharacterized protein Tco025E_02386 [Trypanosoma conorhini]RNF24706.1 hypothetical protein Tco025E_02386 [Trypanosoma conorhini]
MRVILQNRHTGHDRLRRSHLLHRDLTSLGPLLPSSDCMELCDCGFAKQLGRGSVELGLAAYGTTCFCYYLPEAFKRGLLKITNAKSGVRASFAMRSLHCVDPFMRSRYCGSSKTKNYHVTPMAHGWPTSIWGIGLAVLVGTSGQHYKRPNGIRSVSWSIRHTASPSAHGGRDAARGCECRH